MKIFGEGDELHLHMWRDEDGEVTITRDGIEADEYNHD